MGPSASNTGTVSVLAFCSTMTLYEHQKAVVRIDTQDAAMRQLQDPRWSHPTYASPAKNKVVSISQYLKILGAFHDRV